MDDPDFSRIAKALADPTRAAILQGIAQRGEVQCGALFECAGISAATMSHHLRELENAGLIASVKEGKRLKLSFAPDVMKAYLGHIAHSFHLTP